MDFAFSDEQEELRRTVRSFLADKSPESEVRRLMETTEGYDPKPWQQMGEQIGLQSLAIPEEYGGAGYSFLETGVVLEEMGRACCVLPTSRRWFWRRTPCCCQPTPPRRRNTCPDWPAARPSAPWR